MNQNLEIRTARSAALNSLAGLARCEYPGGEIANEKYLEWQYAKNPFGNAIITLALDGAQKPVAQYVVVPMEIASGGNIINGSLSLNTLTHPAYRGKGLFGKTAKATYRYCTENEILFTYGVPNKNSFDGFIKKLGFLHAGNLKLHIKIVNPFGLAGLAAGLFKRKKGSDIDTSFSFGKQERTEFSFFDPEADREQYNMLWSECKKDGKVTVNKTFEYLNWRYFSNPLRKYHVFKLRDGETITAVLAIRILSVYGIKTCIIMDLISRDKETGRTLLNAVFNSMKKNRPAIAIGISTNRKSAGGQLFDAAGFLRVPKMILPQQLPFILKFHGENELISRTSDITYWNFSFGDYDIF